jgi:hypothetical protein
MVEFEECEPPASDALIKATEDRVGIRFPAALRWLFQNANGGRPKPALFANENGRVWVDRTLPLRDGKGSAEWWYNLMVRKKQMVPSTWFPFALDPTGNVLYVDSESDDAMVHAYLHDTAFEPRVDLGIGLDELWALAEQP